jgi:hypothetical protein
MYKLNMIASIIVIASAYGPQRVYSSACSSDPNTLYSWEISFSDLSGTKLGGEAGVWIYGESDGPDIDVGQGTVSGEIGKENVRLTLRRGDKILGTLTLTPKGKPVHRTVGFDLLLSPTFTEKLDYGSHIPVYHEISVDLNVLADRQLRNALRISFAPTATLKLRGNSNRCWDPSEYSGWWTLEYSVQNGSATERALAKGKLAR